MQESSSKSFFAGTNPRNQQHPLNTTDFRISRNYPHPTVGRPGGRPTLPPVDRSVDWVPTESWVTSVGRPTGRPRFNLCTLCTGGRPAPAAVDLFSAAVSLRLRRRLPRRSLDDPSTILINFPISKLSLSNNLLAEWCHKF